MYLSQKKSASIMLSKILGVRQFILFASKFSVLNNSNYLYQIILTISKIKFHDHQMKNKQNIWCISISEKHMIVNVLSILFRILLLCEYRPRSGIIFICWAKFKFILNKSQLYPAEFGYHSIFTQLVRNLILNSTFQSSISLNFVII